MKSRLFAATIPKYRPTASGEPVKPGTSSQDSNAISSKVSANDDKHDVDHESAGSGSAGIVASILVAVSAVSFVLWLAYAYKFPHSGSGQLLIRVSKEWLILYLPCSRKY